VAHLVAHPMPRRTPQRASSFCVSGWRRM
jgi:hypothetical protein